MDFNQLASSTAGDPLDPEILSVQSKEDVTDDNYSISRLSLRTRQGTSKVGLSSVKSNLRVALARAVPPCMLI